MCTSNDDDSHNVQQHRQQRMPFWEKTCMSV